MSASYSLEEWKYNECVSLVSHQMKKNLLLLALIVTRFTVGANSPLPVTGSATVSIFQPIFSDDTLASRKISLLNQQIKIDVFQGYASVRADYWFNNPSETTVLMLTGLPSCTSSGEAI